MFANLKMGTKILAGFALAVAILLVVGGISYSGSQGIEDRLEEASHQKIPSLVALSVALEANLPEVVQAVGAIRAIDAAVPVVVGGQAFASATARAEVERLPGVRHLASLEALEALAAGWGR